MSAPNPKDYLLGRGIVLFAALDANGTPKGYRDLGNAPAFSVTMEQETLEHRSSRKGTSELDNEVTLSRDVNLSFQLEEFNADNLAMLFSGNEASYTNPAVAGFNDVLAYEDVELDRWYDVKNGDGEQAYHIDQDDLTLEGLNYPTETPLVRGVDYVVDEEDGRIRLLPTATNISAGDGLIITLAANAQAASVKPIHSMTKSEVEGALRFISINPANDDAKKIYDFHRVKLTAEGDISLIGNEWANMPFTGRALANTNRTGSQTLTITPLT